MKRGFFTLLVLGALMVGFTGSASAAKPGQFTIKVRNLTGEPVGFNYTNADGNISFATFPAGSSSLTLTEGKYSYWAVLNCGHTAGSFNLVQQSQTIWLKCDSTFSVTLAKPAGGRALGLPQTCAAGKLAYQVYDWDSNYDTASFWKSYGVFCFDTSPTELDSYEATIWIDGDTFWYEYHGTGLGVDNCVGWNDPGEGFYYTEDPKSGNFCP